MSTCWNWLLKPEKTLDSNQAITDNIINLLRNPDLKNLANLWLSGLFFTTVSLLFVCFFFLQNVNCFSLLSLRGEFWWMENNSFSWKFLPQKYNNDATENVSEALKICSASLSPHHGSDLHGRRRVDKAARDATESTETSSHFGLGVWHPSCIPTLELLSPPGKKCRWGNSEYICRSLLFSSTSLLVSWPRWLDLPHTVANWATGNHCSATTQWSSAAPASCARPAVRWTRVGVQGRWCWSRTIHTVSVSSIAGLSKDH